MLPHVMRYARQPKLPANNYTHPRCCCPQSPQNFKPSITINKTDLPTGEKKKIEEIDKSHQACRVWRTCVLQRPNFNPLCVQSPLSGRPCLAQCNSSRPSIFPTTRLLHFSANSGIHSKESILGRWLECLALVPLPFLSLSHSILPCGAFQPSPYFQQALLLSLTESSGLLLS